MQRQDVTLTTFARFRTNTVAFGCGFDGNQQSQEGEECSQHPENNLDILVRCQTPSSEEYHCEWLSCLCVEGDDISGE